LAGASALDLDRPLVAISSFEAAVAGDIRTAGAASALAGLYESRIAELIHGARPAAAREVLARYEALAARAAQAKLTLEPDLASVWATFGRGMIGLGELDTARDHLERSITRRPTLAALEAVATI